jgi:hypothetical protein
VSIAPENAAHVRYGLLAWRARRLGAAATTGPEACVLAEVRRSASLSLIDRLLDEAGAFQQERGGFGKQIMLTGRGR